MAVLPVVDIVVTAGNGLAQSVTITARAAGTSTVTLTVTDAAGATATTSFVVTAVRESLLLCLGSHSWLECSFVRSPLAQPRPR